MGVDCGSRNRAVTEEDLHNAEVDTAFNKPGGIAVSIIPRSELST
jgi:hypothetical protein